jgi:2-polyprenyl-3-methyl-5-hydroxy-6-metoxy-1,4-benzoquinol methylase
VPNYDYTADINNGKIDRGNFDANIQFLERTELLKEGIRILEIGCGAGRLTNYLTQRGFNVIGFDISESLIKDGKVRYPDAIKIIASGDSMPFSNSTFDVILSFDVLEHISDVKRHTIRG